MGSDKPYFFHQFSVNPGLMLKDIQYHCRRVWRFQTRQQGGGFNNFAPAGIDQQLVFSQRRQSFLPEHMKRCVLSLAGQWRVQCYHVARHGLVKTDKFLAFVAFPFGPWRVTKAHIETEPVQLVCKLSTHIAGTHDTNTEF